MGFSLIIVHSFDWLITLLGMGSAEIVEHIHSTQDLKRYNYTVFDLTNKMNNRFLSTKCIISSMCDDRGLTEFYYQEIMVADYARLQTSDARSHREVQTSDYRLQTRNGVLQTRYYRQATADGRLFTRDNQLEQLLKKIMGQ